MKFTFALLAGLAGSVIGADSSKPNPFKIPESGLNTKAATTLNLQWNPTTPGTVSLILRSGAASNLDQGAFIAQKIQNSGTFAWNVPSSITRGSDYTVEIVSDSDPSQMNYTPYFVIDSDNTVATDTGSVTLGAPTEALAGTATGTISAASTLTSSGSPSSSPSSSATTHSSKTDSSMTTTTSSKDTTMSTHSSRSTADAASTTNADASATTTKVMMGTGAASANQIPIVAAGVIALGAMVL